MIRNKPPKKRTIKRGLIITNAKKPLSIEDEKDKQGVFLNNDIPFDYDAKLKDSYKGEVFKFLKGLGIKHKPENYEVFVANLFDHGKRATSISRNQNDYKKSKYKRYNNITISYLDVIEITDLFVNNNLITMYLGVHFKELSRYTRIAATARLLKSFPQISNMVIIQPDEVVILKDKDRKLVDYKDTAETWRIRDILKRVNEVTAHADIRYNEGKLNSVLIAIFIEKFTYYGRLHTKGYMHYQGLSEDQRNEITINGDTIVELDYSGMCINLLYAAEGYRHMGDPYGRIDERAKDNKVVRKFLKKILLCMVNAVDLIQAEKGANFWLYKHHEEREQLKELGITRAKPFIDKFYEVHKDIAHHFCSGKKTGLRIMNKDSKIALDIINHFAKKNIPILAIHDSFIVQQQYKDELYSVMQFIYRKHTGQSIKIK